MKIKTANIRMIKPGGETALEAVDVKKTIEFGGELFFVHGQPGQWSVSHYTTGLAAGVKSERTIAAAVSAFDAVMKLRAHALSDAIAHKLKTYGAANELPGETK